MIKEAMEFLLNKVNYEVREIDGRTYHISNAGFKRLEAPAVQSFSVSTLTGLVDYINSNVDKFSTQNLILHVENEKTVHLISALIDGTRDHYITAKAQTPRIHFDTFLDNENFNIMLQACFEKTNDMIKILKLIGNIKEEAVKNTSDDGITQSIIAKSGIARVEEVEVPNPVLLVPFRTFTEIQQPESKFILRLRNGPQVAIFEADAGAWKSKAMLSIKEYLQQNIKNPAIRILA